MDRIELIRALFARFLEHDGVRALFDRIIADDAIAPDAARDQLLAHLATPAPGPTDPPAAGDATEVAVRRAFDPFLQRDGVLDLQTRALTENMSVAEATQSLLDHLGQAGDPPASTATSANAGESAGEKFSRSAENALLVRSGLATKEEREQAATNPLTSYTMTELARAFCDVQGISYQGLNAAQLIGRAIDPGTANLDATDFPAILENVMNKALFRGFEQAEITWSQWCSTGSESDFKPYTRAGVSQFDSLAVVDDNNAITDGVLTDKKEGGAIQTYAKKLSLSRQAMVNDDLSAFSDAGFKLGEAANRTVDEVVYTNIEANPAMTEDAIDLFDAAAVPTGHANLVAAGAPPDEAGIIASKVAMAAQLDQNGILVGIRPRIALGPVPLEDALIKLATAEFSPDGSANPFEPNSVRNTFVPVSSARLTSAVAWYMLGPIGTTCEVTFLNGQASPSIERDEGWSVFAMHWRVWIDFAVLFLDWRAAYKNNGA